VGDDNRSIAEDKKRQAKTLGDVIYANKAAARIPENHWVALVHSIAAGDQLALHALYAQTNRIVFTLIMRMTGNRETAEELTVDVFYDVWRRSSTYDPAVGSVLGWIMNQARSRAIDRLRHDQRKKRVGDAAVGSSPVTAQETSEARESGALLQRALVELAPEERQAIETAFFSELTHRETANKLNVPVGTVKTRIRSGLGKIRQALGKTGIRE
jgi:RNA polymerase sigma-70 factor, ECF subfamily